MALGSAPISVAIDMPIPDINAAQAVLDIKFVRTIQISNIIANKTVGLEPAKDNTVRAIKDPAPVSCNACPIDNVPTKEV